MEMNVAQRLRIDRHHDDSAIRQAIYQDIFSDDDITHTSRLRCSGPAEIKIISVFSSFTIKSEELHQEKTMVGDEHQLTLGHNPHNVWLAMSCRQPLY